ncbi:MAG: ornithine carbamoyltransferase [Candidatus Micrarchaeota archaeon]
MNLLTVRQLNAKQISEMMKIAEELKNGKERRRLENRTLVMLFEKPSTRTRVSFEVAMTQLGGHAIYLDFVGSQISRGETFHDTALTLSRYADVIMARLYKHSDIAEMAKHSRAPIINGLTDLEHPCQALGDILTIREKGKLKRKAKLAYVGDCANNVANSLMLAAAKMGMDVALVGPAGYPPNNEYVREAKKSRVKVEFVSDVAKGVKGADVIYTDVWISMGMEEEKSERMKAFVPYQVNKEMLAHAKKDCIVMHCLPAHRGLEITSDVLDGKHSVVWDQAENRLHIQKAILLYLLANKK